MFRVTRRSAWVPMSGGKSFANTILLCRSAWRAMPPEPFAAGCGSASPRELRLVGDYRGFEDVGASRSAGTEAVFAAAGGGAGGPRSGGGGGAGHAFLFSLRWGER